VRDVSVAVVLAMAINPADPDGAKLCAPFTPPVRSAHGVSAPAMARDRGLGPPRRTLLPDRGRALHANVGTETGRLR
jgi:hypothetical protein